MKKKVLSLFIPLFFLIVLFSNLVSATPNWDISGNWTFYNFLIPPGNVANKLVVNSFNQVTGEFSGKGYDSNSTFFWMINGTVNGNNISYNIWPVYDNTFPNINATGLIRNSTFMNGSCTAVGKPLGKWLAFGNARAIQSNYTNYTNQSNVAADTAPKTPEKPFTYAGEQDSNYISSNEVIKLKEGESAVKEAYRIKITVVKIGPDYVDATINFNGRDTYFNRNNSSNYTGCENVVAKQVRVYTEPYTGQNLWNAARTLYRSHFFCDGKKDTERIWAGCPGTLTGGRQIIHLEVGYYNYDCSNRYYEQCIGDGTFDKFYSESCDYGLVRFKVSEKKYSSEFDITLVNIQNNANDNVAMFKVKGTKENVDDYGLTDKGYPQIKFYDTNNVEKTLEVTRTDKEAKIEDSKSIAITDIANQFVLKNNELYIQNDNNEETQIGLTPSEAIEAAIEKPLETETKPEIEINVEGGKAFYSFKTEEKTKFLFIPVTRKVEAKINAEDGGIEKIKKEPAFKALLSAWFS